jgi:predicted nucleic acid-binding protein
MPAQLLDTNVLVRFLTGDPPKMAAKTRRLFERADAGEISLVLLPVILAETIYTLESFYEMERTAVAGKLVALLGCRGIEAIEGHRVLNALARCRDSKAHFSDAYLAASAAELKHPIASFDRDFDKFRDVTRIEPKD